jgi:hypothetical protein
MSATLHSSSHSPAPNASGRAPVPASSSGLRVVTLGDPPNPVLPARPQLAIDTSW